MLSLLTCVGHLKHAGHRPWASFQAHLAFAVAVFNLLVAWNGHQPDTAG